MKIGIMQPYFVPYIGFWQLLNAVDQYVIYDDVNFIKGGWINRNRILVQGKPQYFNIQMEGASPFKKINEINVNSSVVWREKAMKTIDLAYRKAPYFNTVYPLIEKIIFCGENNLAQFVTNSIRCICDYLDITTRLIISSEFEQDRALRGQDRVLDICSRLQATEYYNAIGGRELYSKDAFAQNGIELHFLKTNDIMYQQFENDYTPYLSIIDVMMFNSKEEMCNLIHQYALV
ncbi:MAG: WbqC family protein [Lentisphaerae bacterium]|nr:WbqC family protein [Lentisphaerota bacterium]